MATSTRHYQKPPSCHPPLHRHQTSPSHTRLLIFPTRRSRYRRKEQMIFARLCVRWYPAWLSAHLPRRDCVGTQIHLLGIFWLHIIHDTTGYSSLLAIAVMDSSSCPSSGTRLWIALCTTALLTLSRDGAGSQIRSVSSQKTGAEAGSLA